MGTNTVLEPTVAEETFGDRLRSLREEKGLTQGQLASLAGMHLSGLAQLERDEYSPSWLTVQALATALGKTVMAFAGTVAPPEEKPARPRGRPRKKSPPADQGEGEEPSGQKRKRKGKGKG